MSVAGATKWESVLPVRSRTELEARERLAPALARLQPWGPRLRSAFATAAGPVWPYAERGDVLLRATVRAGTAAPQEALLRKLPVRIGRGEGCEIQLPSKTVSTEHAELRLENDALVLVDRKSLNGTRCNGEAVKPLIPLPLGPGAVVEIGSFTITLQEFQRGTDAAAVNVEARTRGQRLWRQRQPFSRLGHPSDRFVRVEWSGNTGWLRVPAAWIRACWQTIGDPSAPPSGEIDAIEHGAAQYVLLHIAAALGDTLGTAVQVGGWLAPAEADALEAETTDWWVSDVEIDAAGNLFTSSFLLPIGEPEEASSPLELEDLRLAAAVDVGVIHLTRADWSAVRAGDALLPDRWLAPELALPGEGDRELGRARVRVGRFSHRGALRSVDGRLEVTLDERWTDSLERDWSMAENEAPDENAGALPVDEIELQVVVELDRLGIDLATLRGWKAGETIVLEKSPSDPLRLVLETGVHRRVLAEGRVVVVDGKLAVEIVRMISTIEPAKS